MSPAVTADAATTEPSHAPVAIDTRDGPVEISAESREVLLTEISRRGNGGPVVRALEEGSASDPVSLDWSGRIVVFDAVWTLAENAGGDNLIDPQLRLLRERLRDEIAQGPAQVRREAS
jgi:hypothetical protein